MLFIISPLKMTNQAIDLDALAFEKFNCIGKIDYSLDEASVDSLLGKLAYCGGELPENVLDVIEGDQASKSLGRYIWEAEDDADEFANELESLGIQFERSTEEKKDWNESWRSEFKEIVVSETLKVVPSWEKVEGQDSTCELYIYPGMGFGTGNHETTFLCLKLYENIRESLELKKVLDFGCGSGILGIAAIKKDRAVVDFVDIDADALDNCLQNLNFNNYQDYSLDHSLVLRNRFEPSEGIYELIFANILENVLELEKNLLVKSVQEGGYLIVSGLLRGQEIGIIELYSKAGFIVTETLFKGDWVAISMQKSIGTN